MNGVEVEKVTISTGQVVSVCLTICTGSLTVVDITVPVVIYSSKQAAAVKGKHEN